MNRMQHRADSALESRLDSNDYNEASLIELKVPLDLPYQNDWEDFERYDGEVTFEGQHYKYVKRKVQDGMLIVKCITNENKHRIESARDQFFQLANDLQNNDSPKKSDSPAKHSITKNSITECEEFAVISLSNLSSPVSPQKINGSKHLTITRPQSRPAQPPEASNC